MHSKLCIIISIILFSHTSISGEKLPDDVSRFIEKREQCDHFRGEEPYDEERRKFLEENLIKLCTGTDAALAGLKNKYESNENILQKLSVYEIDIELNK